MDQANDMVWTEEELDRWALLEVRAEKKAIEKGLKQGLEQGIQQGIQQGREQGHAEGRAEGEANERAKNEVAKAARDKKIAEYLRSIGVSEDGVAKALSIK